MRAMWSRLALVVFLSAGVAGCGGGDDDGGPPKATRTPTVATATPEPTDTEAPPATATATRTRTRTSTATATTPPEATATATAPATATATEAVTDTPRPSATPTHTVAATVTRTGTRPPTATATPTTEATATPITDPLFVFVEPQDGAMVPAGDVAVEIGLPPDYVADSLVVRLDGVVVGLDGGTAAAQIGGGLGLETGTVSGTIAGVAPGEHRLDAEILVARDETEIRAATAVEFEAVETPEATKTPDGTLTPGVTLTPEVTLTPAATGTATATGTPVATTTPTATVTTTVPPTNTPTASPTPTDAPAQGCADATRCIELQPGENDQEELLAALIDAQPGDVIVLAAGTYELEGQLSLSGVDHVTIRGAGINQTRLSFANQTSGAEGLLVTDSDDFTIEDLSLLDSDGDLLKILNSDGVIIRRVRTEWTNGPDVDNGAYGLYPVQCSNVLIEDSIVRGASDAGVYVGQSNHIIVRRNTVEFNVAGIEIENSTDADVYENIATHNTGGILVFNLPGLPVRDGKRTRVFHNQSFSNDTPNFAPPGNTVAAVPDGTGIMILANDQVEVFENTLRDNGSSAITVISFQTAEILGGFTNNDPLFDPYSEGIFIHDNTYIGGGDNPDPDLAPILVPVAGGLPVPNLTFDGFVDESKFVGGELPAPLRICVQEPGGVTLINLDVPGAFANASKDPAPYDCTLERLPPVVIPGVDEPSSVTVFNGEANRLNAYATVESGGMFAKQTVIERRASDPNGLDINGQICFTRAADGSRRFIAGEDTGQPNPPQGWGFFRLDGDAVGNFSATKLGKLTPTYQGAADNAENYGCGFLRDGRLFTTDVGDQALGPPDGQLIVWFPPFDAPNPRYCKIDVAIGTAQGIAIDYADRVLVASARVTPGVYRYTGPFPTSDDAAGGCGRLDVTGAPLVDEGLVTKELFIPADDHAFTPNAVVIKPDGGYYVSSVLNGVIAEYGTDRQFIRRVLQPPPGSEPLPPFPDTGTPLGLGLARDGTLYFADIGLEFFPSPGPGDNLGGVRRIRFVAGQPQPPEVMDSGLNFPDGIGILEE